MRVSKGTLDRFKMLKTNIWKSMRGGTYIKVVLDNVSMTAHGSVLGASGFDLYEKRDGSEIYVQSLLPPVDGFSIEMMKNGYESVIDFAENKTH